LVTADEESFTFQEINTVEAIVAPAFAYLEVAREFSDHAHPLGVSVIDHFHTILVFSRLWETF
jgi:hypothetical protein